MARKKKGNRIAAGKTEEKNVKDVKIELLGVGLLAVAAFAGVSLATDSAGAAGAFVRRFLAWLAGEGRYLVPVVVGLLGLALVREGCWREELRLKLYGAGGLLLVALVLLDLWLLPPEKLLRQALSHGLVGDGGGVTGAFFSYVMRRAFGVAGTYVILGSITLACLALTTTLSPGDLIKGFWERLLRSGRKLKRTLSNFLFTEVVPEEEEISPVVPVIIDGVAPAPARPETPPVPEASPPSLPEPPAPAATDTATEKKPPTQPAQISLEEVITYRPPPLSLLNRVPKQRGGGGARDITENIRILEDTLASFGVKAKVLQVTKGPAVTRFEVQPAPGVKVSRIVSLADDIALAMAAPDVRIEAPIPGKAAIGIEVPNEEVSLVHLRELLESKEFTQSASPLTVALGKGIAGQTVVADLTQMPHLLIAGATGAGKSVCLNTLIVSILFKAGPDTVKFVLIDPKMVELATYNEIPHLACPVVTDAKKAAATLRWLVREMEKRYEALAVAGVRDITRYNSIARTGEEKTGRLPYIVVVIDELADLMMVAPVDVEDAICRLAQMARAAGIHLVVATQRPSVDVITGLIKANIPSRISFAVSSQVDSRTILDMAGAEKLLGRGDMLFFPVGAGKPVRVQGAYLSDREVEAVVEYLKKLGTPVTEEIAVEVTENEEVTEDDDELLPQAVEILLRAGHASISLLQRRLKIGYARAARLVDIMERRGIVGPFEGSKSRAILITWDQYRATFNRRK
ncbi:DNA translocase FtsK 4TM domain-containing protein [Thermodesulfitimonas sp.]